MQNERLLLVCRIRCIYPSFPRRRKIRFLEGRVCHSTPGTVFENNLGSSNNKIIVILNFLLLPPTMDGHISCFGSTFPGELDAEEVYLLRDKGLSFRGFSFISRHGKTTRSFSAYKYRVGHWADFLSLLYFEKEIMIENAQK